MLRLCRTRLALVTGGAITHAVTKLNDLLDLSGGKAPVPHDQLKAFLRESVMPVLAGTELDRRGNSTSLRQYLAQLTRDASFAASVVKARPDAGFVQSITSCIKEDSHRMRFVSKMSSAQACKTIEHLCKVGVADEAVFPVLIAQLDYTNLQELARVMLGLANVGLHELNLLVVVPLYCGDTWEAEVQNGASSSGGSDEIGAAGERVAQSSNVFEAVRVLRALSKSCRACVEARRDAAAASSASLAELPWESLHLFRNNILKFLFENGSVLRGAHWVNVVRALKYFPSGCSELKQLDTLCPLLEAEVQRAWCGADGGKNSRAAAAAHKESSPLTCDAVAAAAIAHAFDYAEHRKPLPLATAAGDGHPSAAFPFDLNSRDVVKLLVVLEQCSTTAPAQAAVQATRVATALRAISNSLEDLRLGDVVQVLQTLRRLPPSAEATSALNVVVADVSVRLSSVPPEELLRAVPFRFLIQLAAVLSALRVTRCDGFVSFLCGGVTFFPRTLTVETTLTFANALANVANERSAACHGAMQSLLVRLLRNYEAELRTAPLVSAHPHAVTKILRACVLIDYVPDTEILGSLLGSEAAVPLVITPEVKVAGGALVFGLTRSMAHFAKYANLECPERVEELWTQGVLQTLLPMSVACTQDAEVQAGKTQRGEMPAYTAVTWRTSLEMIAAFVDATFDHIPAEVTARRVVAAVPLCVEMLTSAASAASMQLQGFERKAGTAAELKRRLDAIPFTSNCFVHLLSSLLMLEYLVYQCAALAQTSKAKTLPEEVKAQLTTLRDVTYADLLRAPLHHGAKTTTASENTVMDVVHRIFACPVSTSSTTSATAVLLTRQDALEITTNLPFALSLIMHPGPVNEYFTEHCMSLMVADGDDDA